MTSRAPPPNYGEVKTDFKKTLDTYQAQQGKFRLLEVPPMQYLMVDGHGDPNTAPAYTAALEVLYPLAYALKFISKGGLGRDYVVPPLEGLWWAEDPAAFTTARDKSQWDWTLMLMVPGWLGAEHWVAAQESVATKKPLLPLGIARLETLDEQLCVQTLHVGPFDDEGPVLAELHDRFIPGHGLAMTGRHHEIYLSDQRRSAPERLRTVLRQPVLPTT